MRKSNVRGANVKRSFAVFGSLKVLVCAAIFVALSIVLGKFVPLLNFDVLRFSLENLPILMAGIMFGPAVGAVVGGVADLVGCVLVGYTINPLVTAGAIAIGLVSGLFSFYFVKKLPLLLQVAISVGAAHIIGSVLIKSVGLAAYYDWPLWQLMLIRLLNYVILGVCETAIIYILMRNKGVYSQIEKMRR